MKFILKKMFVLGILMVISLPNGGYGQITINIPNLPSLKPMSNLYLSVTNHLEQKTIIPGHYDVSATQPSVDKTSIVIMPFTHIPIVDGKLSDTWAWTPTPRFIINGPLEGNSSGNYSVANIAFTFPDGTPWYDEDCGEIGAVTAGFPAELKCSEHNPDKKAKMTTQTGVFGFKISLRNNLTNKKIELMAGKVTMDKFVDNPTHNPKFAKHFVYYPRLDWKFPMALLYTTQPTEDAETNGPLKVMLWFRGNSETTVKDSNLIGQLFYQGKQVAEANGAETEYSEATDGRMAFENDSAGKVFTFNALLFETNRNNTDARFPIYKNQGVYELKIMQNGKLARSIQFVVDRIGHIVNNGINKNNNLGTTKILVPAEIIGEQDTKLDKTAWQTEGYWGNPLVGFVAQ